MSDIPLHSLGGNKFRAGRSNNTGIQLGSNIKSKGRMPLAVRVAAAASSSNAARRNLAAGKWKERYVDDPEEEAGLLGSDEDAYGEDGGPERRRIETPITASQVL
jgi:hypothetical protein